MEILNLAGTWKTNCDGKSRDFLLPGSTCDNKIGKKQEFYQELNKETVRAPREKYEYIGKIQVTRQIDIPKSAEGKAIRVFLERVNVASSLFVDGKQIGRQIISLSTPHIYNLTDKIEPGLHEFTLELDNSNLVNLADMASGYSVDTQGYWNGVIGRIELQWEEKCHIDSAQVFCRKDNSIDVRYVLASDEQTPEKNKGAKLVLQAETMSGNLISAQEYEIKLFATKHNCYVNYKLDDSILWDEFSPNLYKLYTTLIVGDDIVDKKETTFGVRFFETINKEFHLNGRRIAIRGNVDCAQFPKTGYPPMTEEVWEHNLGMMKAWGLNMVRFHAWCPPEAAFSVADRLGMYLQVEMPMWLNVDVTPLELGDDPIHESFFRNESISIIRNYGNHPSFMFFSNGNENMGDYAFLEDNIRMLKAMDDRHLYAVTSNFDHPVGPVEDYFLAMHANGLPVRIQEIHDQVAESTSVKFDEAVDSLPVPMMNFEVGQYAVYPDVDIISDYDGNMLPVNYDVIKKEMIKAGVYDDRRKYVEASGNMAWRLYKEDVEAVYRTKGMNGYQLLAIQDYPGQFTATVGILDVMYRDKGIVEKDKWRQFVGPVVPLFESKRIYKNTEILHGKLGLYDYGPSPIANVVYEVEIVCENKMGKTILKKLETTEQEFSIDLSTIKQASRIEIKVKVESYVNSWNVYVYPDEKTDELSGESIKLENPVSCQYIPVFWSPVMFETDKPSGAIIARKHKIFEDFPTEIYPDYQWKTLLDRATAIDLAELTFDAEPLVELVPNFMYNKKASVLLEGIKNNKKVLYCGLDLESEDIPTQHLKNCIYNYVRENDITFVKICKA